MQYRPQVPCVARVQGDTGFLGAMRTCFRQAAPCCMLRITRELVQLLNAYLQMLLTGILSISNPNKVATLQRL